LPRAESGGDQSARVPGMPPPYPAETCSHPGRFGKRARVSRAPSICRPGTDETWSPISATQMLGG